MARTKKKLNKINSSFGAWAKSLRLSKGLTQMEVASGLGYRSSQAVANIERGVSGITYKRVDRFCSVFDVDPQSVIDRLANDHKNHLKDSLIRS